MRISATLFGLVLEATFLIYCIYMIYLMDVQDPFPREWMIPNMLIGAAVLGIGFLIASRMKRSTTGAGDERLPDRNRFR